MASSTHTTHAHPPTPHTHPHHTPTHTTHPRTPQTHTTHPHSPTGYQEVDLFQEIRGGQPDFDSVFGSTSGHQRMPVGHSTMGEILLPTATGPLATQQTMSKPEAKGLTSDVESSLVRAAENLSEWWNILFIVYTVHVHACAEEGGHDVMS